MSFIEVASRFLYTLLYLNSVHQNNSSTCDKAVLYYIHLSEEYMPDTICKPFDDALR